MSHQVIYMTDMNQLPGFFNMLKSKFANVDLEAWMKEEISYLQMWEAELFAVGKSPSGQQWQELSPLTIAKKGSEIILIDTLRLWNAEATTSGSGDSVREGLRTHNGCMIVYGTTVEYAGFLQTGTRKMPARPHIGVNLDYFKSFARRAVAAVFDGVQRMGA
jgi:hypothetical protein